MTYLKTPALLTLCMALTACPSEEDAPTDTATEDTATPDYGDFCDTFCTDGADEINAVACPAQEVIEYQACFDDCELQLTYIGCPELLQAFWQCTLDVYPGAYECDAATGDLIQPAGCETEQQAVSDCINAG